MHVVKPSFDPSGCHPLFVCRSLPYCCLSLSRYCSNCPCIPSEWLTHQITYMYTKFDPSNPLHACTHSSHSNSVSCLCLCTQTWYVRTPGALTYASPSLLLSFLTVITLWQNNYRGMTPLHLAIHHANPSIVGLLLQKGADVNERVGTEKVSIWVCTVHVCVKVCVCKYASVR